MTARSQADLANDGCEMAFPCSSDWARKQWGAVQLGDARLNRRALQMALAMAAHRQWSIPQQMGNPTALQGAYDLLNHRQITLDKLSGPHGENTRRAAGEHEVVLFVQDTTELDYTSHQSKEGLGPIGNNQGRGLLLHTTLSVVPEATPQILGVAHQQTVLRQAAPHPRPKYTRSPEGEVWAKAAEAVGEAPQGAVWVQVGDGGADDFRFMPYGRGKHFLLRVTRNRLLAWEEEVEPEMRKLRDYARQLPVQHRFTLQVARGPKRPARTAQMCLSWAEVTIPAPAQAAEMWRHQPSIRAWVLRAWEEAVPEGAEALEWVLLTSIPTVTLDEALERRQWYAHRWLVEDYHQCLKSGYGIEKSRLDHGDDINRLLGFCGPIAAELLRLRQIARANPETPAEEHIDPFVVSVLRAKMKWPSTTVLCIDRFWRAVAQLGGHLGRRGDGPPGWRTMWRGWQYLSDLVSGARLYAQHSQGQPPAPGQPYDTT